MMGGWAGALTYDLIVINDFVMSTLLIVISISSYILELGTSRLALRGESQPEAVQHMQEGQMEITWRKYGWEKKGPYQWDRPFLAIS